VETTTWRTYHRVAGSLPAALKLIHWETLSLTLLSAMILSKNVRKTYVLGLIVSSLDQQH
jgi:hypothetical protein